MTEPDKRLMSDEDIAILEEVTQRLVYKRNLAYQFTRQQLRKLDKLLDRLIELLPMGYGKQLKRS